MSILVNFNGNDVTEYLLEYNRTSGICTGVSTLDIKFTKEFPHTPEPWDEIVIYEDGNKKGTFNVTTNGENSNSGEISLQAQDDSKKLFDTFVFEITSYDYVTTARFWIENFLTYAGVNYEFNTTSYGSQVDVGVSLGAETAYDLIIPLLQQSGWYIYFDQNGKAIIGELIRTSSYVESFNNSNILEISIDKSDKMSRNRAVVWGRNPSTYVDISVNTSWQYDSNDKRAVVLQNSSIYNQAVSTTLANMILTEFRDLTIVKTLVTPDFYNVFIGDMVMVNHSLFRGLGMITTLSVSVSKSGRITTLILDERCPRIFGYVAPGDDYVYVGTWGNGIWRRQINLETWEDFSTGLEDFYIYDLHINNGIFATVAGNYLYVRSVTDTGWIKIHQGELTDENDVLYEENDTLCVSCTIDKVTNVVYGGYVDITNTKSWVLTISPTNTVDRYDQVYYATGDLWNNKLIDIDHDTNHLYATLAVNTTGLIPCGETFTTNNETSVTKSFQSPTWAKSMTDPIMCGTEIVFATNPLPPDDTYSKIYVINHSAIYDPLVSVTHESSLLPTTGIVYTLVKYSADLYYLVTVETASPSIYRHYSYNIRTGVLTYVGSHTLKTSNVKNIFYKATINKDSITIDWIDIFTQSTGSYTVYSPSRDNKTLLRFRAFGGGNVFVVGTLVESYNTPLSEDNGWCGCSDLSCDGTELCGAGDQDSMYSGKQHHLTFQGVGINLDTLQQITVQPVYIVSSVTSHGTLTKSGFWSGNYVYSNGALYVFVQGEMSDAGYWTCNPDWPGFLQTPCILTGAVTYQAGMLLELTGNATGIPGDIIISGNFSNLLHEKGVVPGKETNGTLYVFSDTSPIGGIILWDTGGNYLSGNYGRYADIYKMDYLYGQMYAINSVVPVPQARQLFLSSYTLPDFPINEDRRILLTTLSILNGEALSSVTVGENIVGIKKSQWTGSILQYRLLFSKFGNDVEEISETYVTALSTSGGFIYQDTTILPHRLEISQNYPVTTFSPFDFSDYNLRLGGANEAFYSPPLSMGITNVSDSRTFPVFGSGGADHVGIATDQSFKMAPIDFSSDWETLFTLPSGSASRIETSNLLSPPHYFLSVSGIPFSGGGFFYQKLSTDFTFTDYTNNLPPSTVTIIRMDDII